LLHLKPPLCPGTFDCYPVRGHRSPRNAYIKSPFLLQGSREEVALAPNRRGPVGGQEVRSMRATPIFPMDTRRANPPGANRRESFSSLWERLLVFDPKRPPGLL
jgi:hypothetical protein